jgi:putative phosphoesterase
MKIGIISDTHGSYSAWEKAINTVLKDAELIIHCGDIFYHGTRNPLPKGYDTLKLTQLINECPTPILIAKGNCDSEIDQMVLNHTINSPIAAYEAKNFKIVAQHYYSRTQEDLINILKKSKANIYLTGHTHIPSLEITDNILFINPGSPSLTNEEKKRLTVAVLELKDKKAQAKIVDINNTQDIINEINFQLK